MILQHGILEISAPRLRHNLAWLRAKLPPSTRIAAVVKANAYGHGLDALIPLLDQLEVTTLCVYSMNEASEVAHLTKNCGILAMAPCTARTPETIEQSAHFPDICRRHIQINLTDARSVQCLCRAIDALHDRPLAMVHVQVDTGLTRMGVAYDEAPELIRQILAHERLRLVGLFTHLSHGDVPGHPSVAEQIARLHRLADPIKREHPDLLIHAQNSGGAWHQSDPALDMVRLGIAMYGLQPSPQHLVAGLQPIARLIAPILAIHQRPKGTGVGYGHTFITQRDSRLAIVPVGYADGYPRALSNRGIVQINGRSAPVVGRVSMDQMIIDVTDIPADIGDTVTVISHHPGDANCMDRIAADCGTIGYEIATGLGARLARDVVDRNF